MHNGFMIAAQSKECIVFSFEYPFTLLIDKEVGSDHLSILNKYIKSEGSYVQVSMNINLTRPSSSFLRLDPHGELVSNMNKHVRKVAGQAEVFQ